MGDDRDLGPKCQDELKEEGGAVGMKGMDQGRGQNVLATYITCLRSNFD